MTPDAPENRFATSACGEASPCPCGSGSGFGECCGPLLAGKQHAETAEALMRSRYSAFVQGDMDYLLATMSPELREDFDVPRVREWNRATRWSGLTVHETVAGGTEDASGEVRFTACYQTAGRAGELREHSLFCKVDGRWFYSGQLPLPQEDAALPPDSAVATVRRETPKVGRNAPCPCGSGKKFKRCCG